MDLTLAAIVIMGGWVVAILAGGLAMALRAVTCQEIAPGRHRVVTGGLELSGRHTVHGGYAIALCVGTDLPVES